MRVEVLEGVEGARSGAGRPAAMGTIDDAGVDVAEVDVAVRELHLEVVAHVVGHARMRRPGELPLREVVLRIAKAGRTVGDVADVGDTGKGVARKARPGPAERREAKPGPDAHIT